MIRSLVSDLGKGMNLNIISAKFPKLDRKYIPPLQTPPNQYLSPGLACRFGDSNEGGVGRFTTLDHGGVGFKGDIVGLAVLDDSGLLDVSGAEAGVRSRCT
jgi:hypothetical protein